jgi:hypothetical protein
MICTAYWKTRHRRVIGMLSKNKKYLLNVFVLQSFPNIESEGSFFDILAHPDTSAFSMDANGKPIIYDLHKKELSDIRPLSDFFHLNVKHLEEQYMEIWQLFNGEK